MNKISLLFCISVSVFTTMPIFSQEDNGDYLYQLHQIEGTEDSVLSFFKKKSNYI
jgi:hypothetical protein